jgi:GTP diphosphokinase / guanosine-3',5'-bis(diphosphate) 3'-diphosphatase
MHRIAEEGIAAHWKYKEGKRAAPRTISAWPGCGSWWSGSATCGSQGEFMSTLKVDLYPEEVYTFTPRGKVIVLPRDATPIDFAYSIHSDVGNACVGAKVNGRIVPLKYMLRNGDVVEIMTQPGHMPSRDWLAIVKTSRARNKIKHVINAIERLKAIEIGQKYLEREARRLGWRWGGCPRRIWKRWPPSTGTARWRTCTRGWVREVFGAAGAAEAGALAVQGGAGAAEAGIRRRARGRSRTAGSYPWRSRHQGEGHRRPDGVPGEVLQSDQGRGDRGYVTRGKGVAVHSKMCSNVQNLMYDVERKIEVEWAKAAGESFAVRLTVRTDDRPGMLNQLTNVLFTEQSNIRSLEARSDEKRGGDGAMVEMTAEIRDKKQLERIVSAIRRISGVRDVERVQ